MERAEAKGKLFVLRELWMMNQVTGKSWEENNHEKDLGLRIWKLLGGGIEKSVVHTRTSEKETIKRSTQILYGSAMRLHP